jgi:hypothetical protein
VCVANSCSAVYFSGQQHVAPAANSGLGNELENAILVFWKRQNSYLWSQSPSWLKTRSVDPESKVLNALHMMQLQCGAQHAVNM